MSRGKPKGSARSEVKHYADLADKLRVCISGRVAKYAERELYVGIFLGIPLLRANANLRGLTPAQLAKRIGTIEKRMADAVVDAVNRNDDRFFERMAEIARFYKDRKSAADPLGAGVIGAMCNIQRKKKLSGREIADYINRVWPRADGGVWDERDVNKAKEEMGID